MPTRSVFAAVAAGLMLTAGCSPPKLNESRSYTLPIGEAKGLELPAISRAQKLTVEFTSKTTEVTVVVFKASDVKQDDLAHADLKTALAQKQGKEGSFVADVPANTATWLVVRGANKETDVTLKVTNAK